MSSLTELIPQVGFQSVNGAERLEGDGKLPYNIEEWRIDRFQGAPPPMKWLVKDYIPLGVAGCLYSPGGSGKSTLALDLAIRVSIAPVISSSWLGAFPVAEGGSVVYLSAEEPEDVLHRRFRALCDAIGEENLTRGDLVFSEAVKKLFLANLWGKVNPLFEITNTSLDASAEYWKIRDVLERLKKNGPIRLIVLDTRSRFSGAEGAGNALVSREVALYEKLACEFGATILILHHTNKASFQGGNPMAAQRGESAFLDCLRCGIHLQTLSEEAAKAQGITEEERKKYLVITNSKQNYAEIQGPVVVRREGFQFRKTDTLPRTAGGKSELREQADMEAVLELIRKSPGLSQQGVIRAGSKLSQTISVKRCREAMKNLEAAGMVSIADGLRNAKLYSALDVGEQGAEHESV